MRDLMPTPERNPFPRSLAVEEGVRENVALIPTYMVPTLRVEAAKRKNVSKRFLINTWGGLGDQICSEPAIRYALKKFTDVEISIASRCPSLFSHLKFKEIFDTREMAPNWEDYLVFQTIVNPYEELQDEFFSHMLTHPVDYVSLSMWRCQLPVSERQIRLPDFSMTEKVKNALDNSKNLVVLHAGKHAPSKNLPKAFYEELIHLFQRKNFEVVLIGQTVDEKIGFIEIDSSNCIDLRDQLEIPEFISLLKNANFVFTNDSSPLHAAASGNAFIGFVSTIKHPDLLLHWRYHHFGWRMQNFGKDGLWNHQIAHIAVTGDVQGYELPDGLMEKILPRPEEVVDQYSEIRAARNYRRR